MAARKGLGKGLDTLIPKGVLVNDKAPATENVKAASPDQVVKITKVEPNRNQPRKKFDEDELQELSDSIKLHGVLFPILVVNRGDYYEIVAGERRWRAAKMAGLKEVPVIIRDYTEKQIAEISLIENIQRTDLNPIEEAKAYKDLIDKYNYKQDELAERVSKSRTAITNTMRLLKLSDSVQDMIVEDLISAGHARALLSIDNSDEQYELAQRVMDEKLSVRDIEKIVKDRNKPKIIKKKNEKQEALYHDIEEKLKASLGTKVTITAKGDKMGKIEIDFYNQDDLQKIMDLLLG
ncbi:MAG: ParB/RepB/Spo0J family partition protein [Lachnospiraceae bacterium]|nr:ParB/RepB/Spo0J family partition protein [Lachnospiraceae bacterium]